MIGRPSKKLYFKEELSLEKYLSLLAYLRQKTAEIKALKNRTVNLELNTMNNIHNAIFMLLHTGLRISEIRLITNGDILAAIQKKEFTVYESKKKKYRRVEIDEDTAEKFKSFFKENLNQLKNDNYIIHIANRPTSPLSQNYLQITVNKFLKEALGAGHTSHSFRRFVITNVIKTHGQKTAQQVANHKDIRTTFLYMHKPKKGETGRGLGAVFANSDIGKEISEFYKD